MPQADLHLQRAGRLRVLLLLPSGNEVVRDREESLPSPCGRCVELADEVLRKRVLAQCCKK